MSYIANKVLQEVGSPPAVPTQSEFNHLLAKLAPEKLVEVKNQLKIVMKRKQGVGDPYKIAQTERLAKEVLNYKQVDGMATSEPELQCNKTQVLEMELLKLKGQFQKNKATTMNLIKKLNNQWTVDKESIKELTVSRREELQLIDTVKRDNLDLIHKKHQLELDLIEMSERLEYLQGSLTISQQAVQEKDLKLMGVENEKLEMVNQIEMLKQLNLRCYDSTGQNHFCKKEISNPETCTSPANPSRGVYLSLAILTFCGIIYFYLFSPSANLSEAICTDCDYERVSLR